MKGIYASSKRARIWVVSELYYPEQTSTGYFLTRIAEGLTSDYDVSVLCGQPSYSEKGIKAPSFERRNGTTIRRLRSTHFDKDRLGLRIINFATFTLAVFIAGLLHFRPGDRLLVVTNPPLAPLAAALAARLRGCRMFLLVHDVYPEVLAATGTLLPQHPAYRLLDKLFAITFRLYDGIVVLGRDMAELIRKKIAPAQNEITIIPNWGDVDEIRPITREQNSFIFKYGISDKFVVQFSGNIGRTHDVELLIEASKLLRDRDDILFLFVGYGGKSGLIENAKSENPENLLFLPRQPRDELGVMLASSNLTVISFVPGMLGLSVPSRMYNVMAAGVPILAAADPRSELARTVSENGAGWVMHDANAHTLAELITRLADDPTRREIRERGSAGRSTVTRHYTLPVVLGLFRELFR